VIKNFSGYIAADEIYDGPFCILFIVDSKTGYRLMYKILEHNPTEKDMDEFFAEFHRLLDSLGLSVIGITTDLSPLYPKPIKRYFPLAQHQLCVFHALQNINRGILYALTRFRRKLKGEIVKRKKRGAPLASEKKKMEREKRKKQYITELYQNRTLWVKKRLTKYEKRTLKKLSREQRFLKILRSLMDKVYSLFDKRCSLETAMRKLHRIIKSPCLNQCKEIDFIMRKLSNPNLPHAFLFLDDTLLEATSNSVERSNRRHRKMQKSIYKVRCKDSIECRIKLDMKRDLSVRQRVAHIDVLRNIRAMARNRKKQKLNHVFLTNRKFAV